MRGGGRDGLVSFVVFGRDGERAELFLPDKARRVVLTSGGRSGRMIAIYCVRTGRNGCLKGWKTAGRECSGRLAGDLRERACRTGKGA